MKKTHNLILFAFFLLSFLQIQGQDFEHIKEEDLRRSNNPYNLFGMSDISGDGSMIVTSCSEGIFQIWDGKTNKIIKELEAYTPKEILYQVYGNQPFYGVAYCNLSYSGKYLALHLISDRDTLSKVSPKRAAVLIWDVEKGKEIHRLYKSNQPGIPMLARFTNDERFIAVSYQSEKTYSDEFWVWDVSTGKLVFKGNSLEIETKYHPDLGILCGVNYNPKDIEKKNGLSIEGLYIEIASTRVNFGKLVRQPPQKGWILITKDGRWSALPEDFKEVKKYITLTNSEDPINDPNYLPGFLYQAFDTVRADQEVLARQDHALIFAAQDYDSYSKLQNPIGDAEALAELLENKYGFKVEIVLNPDYETILSMLSEYKQKTFGKYDQLLVFFSGHGDINQNLDGTGFFMPVDAKKGGIVSREGISHGDFMDYLKQIPVNHLLFVADACYSGKMAKYGELRRANESTDRGSRHYRRRTDEQYLSLKLQDRSCIFLASGEEEVSDGVEGGHTPFMRYFLESLSTDRGETRFLPIGYIKDDVQWLKPNEPIYGDFDPGQPTGNFIFVLDPKD